MSNESPLFDTVTPHPNGVQLPALLAEIESVIKKHVILNDHAAAALALWVLHTYTFELRDAVAYVAIESPEKRCGKTTLISVLAAMARKPLVASNISTGALFRAIDSCRPTLFIDEADTFFAGNSAMRGILNSGNTWRAAYVLRLAGARPLRSQSPAQSPPQADDADPALRRYSCWCPKVIALIGEVPDTIADRSIIVKMTRKLISESCAPLTELNTVEIKSKCARFALDAAESIAQCEKIHGPGLNDRAADTFDPLYVLARLAGEAWEAKLQAAAIALTSTGLANNAGAQLLLDILSIFMISGQRKIFSRDLANILRGDSEIAESFAVKNSTIDEYKISKILRPYGIKPTTIRLGGEIKKGYVEADFRDALKRYVPRSDFTARFEELSRIAHLQTEGEDETD